MNISKWECLRLEALRKFTELGGKPRLRWCFDQYWFCCGNGFAGLGKTPIDAYEDWAMFTKENHV